MNAVVRFPPALGHWIAQHLDQGQPPGELVAAMCARDIEPDAARAIVNAFVRARSAGAIPPSSTVDAGVAAPPPGFAPPLRRAADGDAPATPPAPAYRSEPLRLHGGNAIITTDRVVRVAARAERPALALLHGVLTAEECNDLIALARPRLAPSTVVDPATGRDVVTGWRSSLGMFFRPAENPLVARLDRRFAEVMNLPLENGEGLQVLHYPEGAGSAPHFDFLVPAHEANRASIERSGQRVSTLVAYLNEVRGGGETLFPSAGWAVSPQQGNAVYFEYCNSHGELDHASLHGSNAVERGEKWVVTKWMRARKFVSAGG